MAHDPVSEANFVVDKLRPQQVYVLRKYIYCTIIYRRSNLIQLTRLKEAAYTKQQQKRAKEEAKVSVEVAFHHQKLRLLYSYPKDPGCCHTSSVLAKEHVYHLMLWQ